MADWRAFVNKMIESVGVEDFARTVKERWEDPFKRIEEMTEEGKLGQAAMMIPVAYGLRQAKGTKELLERTVGKSQISGEDALSLAMLGLVGGAPGAPKPVPGTIDLGVLTGLKNRLPLEGFRAATVLARKGKTAEEVWKATGWANLGKDWGWVRELSDETARLKIAAYSQKGKEWNFSGKLPEILEHPKLFEAYPELQNLVVESRIRPGVKKRGSLHSWGVASETPSTKATLENLMHEVQHRIGEIEGWPRGGSPEEFKKLLKRVGIAPGEAESLGYLLYSRLADEEIARATVDRLKMPDAYRRGMPFWKSAEHPREAWIKAGQLEWFAGADDPRIIRAIEDIERIVGKEFDSLPILHLKGVD